MQYLSTADRDIFIYLFIHCAFLLAMATPFSSFTYRFIQTVTMNTELYDNRTCSNNCQKLKII